MSQKINPEQLQNCSLEELKAYKADIQKRKIGLEALKVKGGKAWTPELQEELDSLALLLVDVDDAIEEKAKAKTSYTPEPGTEQMVHLSIVQGRRFNPLTGKEESKAFTQLFTFGEWRLFKKHYKSLGFTVLTVLHDPYGDAAEIVTAK